jgi:preprotein translocase SecF subunit
MINFVKYRRFYFILSAILIVVGIAAMIISSRTYPERTIVRLGVDFTGGSIFELSFAPVAGAQPVPLTNDELQALFTNAGLSDVTAQRIGLVDSGRWQVRSNFVGDNPALLDRLAADITAFAAEKNLTFDQALFRENLLFVSPAVGGEVTTAAVVATVVASALVMSWIAFAFRAVKNSLRYGLCALLAMGHDVLIMTGAMSILGLLAGWEADALFLTGLLTVVGFSVQDTIVVFDRIRENDARHRGEPFELIVNRSIMEVIQRSLMTQIAAVFVLLALFLAGGGPIHQFVGVLMIGLISGTYSSIFTAIPLLVAWEKGELPFVNRKARQTATA